MKNISKMKNIMNSKESRDIKTLESIVDGLVKQIHHMRNECDMYICIKVYDDSQRVEGVTDEYHKALAWKDKHQSDDYKAVIKILRINDLDIDVTPKKDGDIK